MKLFVFFTFFSAVMAVVFAQGGNKTCDECEAETCDDCEAERCEDCEGDSCEDVPCEPCEEDNTKQPRWFVPTIVGYDL
ncbi:hypothetical protein JYU34_020181 [Plutella xylostella]|uniref:Uncharacterized protein n=1 Tax=Plutella xylostella TaxID=51655 RepID=A0ABQ7PU21_PLUXY|nr:hypothetical protein JYU34_020181 [Plutella xylostella]